MKILHTSDWHIGRSLYGRKRYEEFEKFLTWLGDTLEHEGIDALLIAGDIFDTSTPGNRAQELYYRFLYRVSLSPCRHVVVIAGNHDSPSFLNAPRELLRALRVYVVGAAGENPEDELIVLRDSHDLPEAIVCAVPFLHDRDIRTVEAGETMEDKDEKLSRGLRDHYRAICGLAERKKASFEKAGIPGVPLIAMGHLFTAGGKTVDGDGVRELYVGNLAHVDRGIFPSSLDYLALGHLHVPQRVGGVDHLRYSGSPIPMGYGEASHTKKVVLFEKNGATVDIREITVPRFQALESITGSLEEILGRIEELKQDESDAWLEIEYTGKKIAGNLREIIEESLTGSAMEIRRIKNKRIFDRVINSIHEEETLDALDVREVFHRCLATFEVPEEDRPGLVASYDEIVHALQQEDRNAE